MNYENENVLIPLILKVPAKKTPPKLNSKCSHAPYKANEEQKATGKETVTVVARKSSGDNVFNSLTNYIINSAN